MTDPPSPAEALAAAVLDRLAAGAAVRLDGLGVLHLTHEAARLEVCSDGSRVLHPPSNGVLFESLPQTRFSSRSSAFGGEGLAGITDDGPAWEPEPEAT